MLKNPYHRLIWHQLLIFMAILLVASSRYLNPFEVFTDRFPGIAYLWVLYIVIGLLADKYNFARKDTYRGILMPILHSNFIFVALVSIFLVLSYSPGITRVLFFGSVGVLTVTELFFAYVFGVFAEVHRRGFVNEQGLGPDQAGTAAPGKSTASPAERGVHPGGAAGDPAKAKAATADPSPTWRATGKGSFVKVGNQFIHRSVLESAGQGAFEFLHQNVPLDERCIVLSVRCRFDILDLPGETPDAGLNLDLPGSEFNPGDSLDLLGEGPGRGLTQDDPGKQFNAGVTPDLPVEENGGGLNRGIPSSKIDTIVNLERVNNHRFLNKFFEAVSMKLPLNGVYVGVCRTKEQRKKRFLRRFTPVLGMILYSFDFLIHRVWPKVPVFRKLYFYLTKGRNRVLARAELLGRLYACGFVVVQETETNGLLYFVARKSRAPVIDSSPTYGPLVRLKRVGKDRKLIGIYKLRTMHPFSEYIQAQLYAELGVQEGGKIANDFRVTTWGRLFRKLWIDELPMLMNWLKGDVKLVGVRPLSVHMFNTYPEYLQELRTRFKPGLVPPFYADMPKTEEEIYQSEEDYLVRYARAPFRTDLTYFFKAAWNILVRRARSN